MGLINHVKTLVFATLALADSKTAGGFTYYKTEPDFKPERFDILESTTNRSQLGPGFLFLTPMLLTWGWGPEIYDMNGELVFYGNKTSSYRVQDFHVCDYLGASGTHLCWHELERRGGRLWGRKRIFDHTYSQVGKNYTATGQFSAFMNGHEFRMADNGTKILTPVYEHKHADLEPYHGPKLGSVHDGCFEEVSVKTGRQTFRWCSMDHFEVWESNLFFDAPGQKTNHTAKTAGDGGVHAWDFVHVNAVDKNEEGDYLISGRHLDQVIKVAGSNNVHGVEPGQMLWRLGGTSNDFDMEGGFSFSKQHAVRYLSTGPTETVLSIFNNGWEGANEPTHNVSAGMIIKVNNETMKATLLHEYQNPEGKISQAQGNTQVLHNGNAVVGWGTVPSVSEFSETGDVLYHASFQNADDYREWNYRAFKFPWVGKPAWDPKLVAYTESCNLSPLVAYASWNGATEVKYWRFSTSIHPDGPWSRIGTVEKSGFETKAEFFTPQFQPYVRAQALDAYQQVLGSTVSATFVPKASVRGNCYQSECLPLNFRYSPDASCASTCGGSYSMVCLSLLLIFAFVESVNNYASRMTLLVTDARLRTGVRYRLLSKG